jgi:ribonuclease BN (tRNA processing enzyme)
MSFDVLLSGVGNAFSTEHYGTHFLLDHPDYLFGIDCPDGYRRALDAHAFSRTSDQSDAAIEVSDLDGLFITHLHGDHVNGLEMALAYRRYVTEQTLDLYGPPTLDGVLWERRLGASLGQSFDGETYNSLGPDNFYDLHIVPWQHTHDIGPFTVALYQTTHHLPAAALKIEADGATLGYSCDTVFDRDLIDWLADADVILHETGTGPGHTDLDDLTALPTKITDRMRLVHYPDTLIGKNLPIPLADEGTRFTIG